MDYKVTRTLDGGRGAWCILILVNATDVIHAIAVISIAFLVIRGAQALAEHYFPDSEAVVAGRFIYGGP